MQNKDIIEAFSDYMKREKISKAELARRLKVSRACVTMMFNKNKNWTLLTMKIVAQALNCKVSLNLETIGA